MLGGSAPRFWWTLPPLTSHGILPSDSGDFGLFPQVLVVTGRHWLEFLNQDFIKNDFRKHYKVNFFPLIIFFLLFDTLLYVKIYQIFLKSKNIWNNEFHNFFWWSWNFFKLFLICPKLFDCIPWKHSFT